MLCVFWFGKLLEKNLFCLLTVLWLSFCFISQPKQDSFPLHDLKQVYVILRMRSGSFPDVRMRKSILFICANFP